MVAAAWYYVKDEAVTGPLDRMTLMEHTFSGEVEPDTLVWSAWDERPRPIHDVPEFCGLLSASAIRGSTAASASFSAPVLSRIASASWILLGGLSLVILMVMAVLMMRNDGTSAWRLPGLLMAASASLLLIREGHMALQGRRQSLARPGMVTFALGAVALVLTMTLEALNGFGSFAFFASLLLVSGATALAGNSAYKSWYLNGGQ